MRGLRDFGSERGQAIPVVAAMLLVLLGLAGVVIDGAHVFGVKRHLQASADAAALAAAQELNGTAAGNTNAETVAHNYSASAGGRNFESAVPSVTTTVTFPPTDKVKVTQQTTTGLFFGQLFGVANYNVRASATAARKSETVVTGTPLAVYVHELCGASTGNKGLQANGKNMLIQGGIHVNGQFKIGDSGFRSESTTTVYRPPHADSLGPPYGPAQGTCNGSGSPKIENEPTARYCTVTCGVSGGLLSPTHGQWKDWVTPYHTADIVKSRVNGGTCTHNPTGDFELKAADFPGGVMSDARFYCLPLDKKFTLTGALKGPSGTHARLTVVAGDVVVNTDSGAKLKPFNDAEPVLFSSWRAGNEMIINPAGNFDWIGYVINRRAGVTINSGGVTSPREGLIEAEWIVINGENFNMIGRGPDHGGTSTTVFTDVSLDE